MFLIYFFSLPECIVGSSFDMSFLIHIRKIISILQSLWFSDRGCIKYQILVRHYLYVTLQPAWLNTRFSFATGRPLIFDKKTPTEGVVAGLTVKV